MCAAIIALARSGLSQLVLARERSAYICSPYHAATAAAASTQSRAFLWMRMTRICMYTVFVGVGDCLPPHMLVRRNALGDECSQSDSTSFSSEYISSLKMQLDGTTTTTILMRSLRNVFVVRIFNKKICCIGLMTFGDIIIIGYFSFRETITTIMLT